MPPNDPDAVAARDAAYRTAHRYLERERATNAVAVLPADIGRVHLDRKPCGEVVASVATREPGGHHGALVICLRRAAGAGWQVRDVERFRRDLGDPPAETLADRMRRVEHERHQAATQHRRTIRRLARLERHGAQPEVRGALRAQRAAWVSRTSDLDHELHALRLIHELGPPAMTVEFGAALVQLPDHARRPQPHAPALAAEHLANHRGPGLGR